MDNKKRARDLAEDIQEMNPQRWEELKKQGNPLEQLEKILDLNDKKKERIHQQIIEDRREEWNGNPIRRMQIDQEAEMIAQEMAQEEISNLY